MSDKVKVAIRVRPMNRREKDLATKCCVDIDSNQTILFHPNSGIHELKKDKDGDTPQSSHHANRKAPKIFAFDHCFWSMDDTNPKYSGQEKVFHNLGADILERAFEGYNACIFAYGQTGSGKSYTMMGTMNDQGVIPRLCDSLFQQVASLDKEDPDLSCKVEVSYMEIYNEKVHDLLDPKGGKHNLRVREHNILGPYVDGLSQLVVTSFEDIDTLMSEGNKSRTVAATNMNSESSRSHAVFNIILTQTLVDRESSVTGEKVSKLSLVDLAGSERAQKTGAVGERLKEGSNINKSLTTLGLVISALADQSGKSSKNKFVPYRDSVLTWLLKDNLGGNSKTVMVATLSPAADNYEETLSTLRYADRAKRIVNHAVVNEDPNARIIRELREEVDNLKKKLNEAQSKQNGEIEERLEETQKLFKDMTKTWEEKLTETERIHAERHQALEKMGISVQTSGIKVEQGRCFLVNLNADPSLNELLVYYLKDRTLVGRPDAPVEQDIQLQGLGICPEHCILEIDANDVIVVPLEGARTCVNGSLIGQKTKVRHGDRILWGNNHFFRINCPKANSPSTTEPQQPVDYDFAQQEVMMKEMPDDPIQEAIVAMEKQHEDDKQEALEKQRQMYERQMQMLRNQLMSPSTPSQPFLPLPPFDFSMKSPGSKMQVKYQQWAQEREKLFCQSLVRLKEEVVKANCLVREANFLAQEMGKKTEFSVTLQIPAANLSPNRKRGAFVSEPAILVKRKDKGSQVWSMEKFENKIIDMREMYEERKEKGISMMVEEADVPERTLVWETFLQKLLDMDEGPPAKGDPFYESQENHNLIGVANVFLECLFYDVKLDYQVPIISQQGEVSGRLHIEVCRVAGSMPDRQGDTNSESGDSNRSYDYYEDEGVSVGNQMVCRISIKEAKGLPPMLSNFVFCQYNFWDHRDAVVVAPVVDPNVAQLKKNSMTFKFDHRKEFKVYVTEEFVEHCAEGALSIEVWGHRSTGFDFNQGWEMENVQAKSRSLLDRWGELIRKIELWTEIHELNDQGEYTPVEVLTKPEVLTGGVFQLRQGHSRRILVHVKPIQNSGTLPIICEAITSISVGCICARSKLQKGLDSYQEEDLNTLRDKWSEALMRRREYLDEQIQKVIKKTDKSDSDTERERSLIDQWVCLTEERNAVLVPQAGSGIPGSPADWIPPPGMEQHNPVLFLDLNADDMTTPNAKEGLQAAGINSILPKEHGAKFYNLPIVKYCEKEICAIASWDSSIHDSVHLNRVTPSNERVYMILKVVVRLSHPASMELVLRKRLSINIYKKQSMMDRMKKRMSKADLLTATGVSYEVVSNIPKASEDLEDRESLAQMAASKNEECQGSDGETYLEKYIKGVSAVESILTLDKLRQEVAIKELLSASGRPLRKTASVPNIHGIVRSDSFHRGLDEQVRAESVADLSRSDPLTPDGRRSSDGGSDKDKSPSAFSLGKKKATTIFKMLKTVVEFGNGMRIRPDDPRLGLHAPGPLRAFNPAGMSVSVSEPENIGLPRFDVHMEAGLSVTDCEFPPTEEELSASPKNVVSPQPTKFVKPMRTLLEEQHVRETKPLLIQDSDVSLQHELSFSGDEFDELNKQKAEKPQDQPENQNTVASDDDFTEFESYQSQTETQNAAQNTAQKIMTNRTDSITHSSTTESLVDIQAVKSFTPSMTSSGYGSQAVSTLTLSSEDSASIRSMSIDETPDHAEKSKDGTNHKKDGGEHGEEGDTPNLIDLAVADENLSLPMKPVLPGNNEISGGESQMKGSSSEADSESVIEVSVGNKVDSGKVVENSAKVESSEKNIGNSEKKSEVESVENVSDVSVKTGEVVATGDQNGNEGESKVKGQGEGKVKGQGEGKKVEAIDLYSETAMDELEALGGEINEPKKEDGTVTANSSDSGTGDLKKENSEDSLQSPRSESSDTVTHGEIKDHEKVVRRTSGERVRLRGDVRKSLNLDPRVTNSKREATRENRRSMPEHKLNKMAPSPLKPGARLPGSHDNLSVQKKKAELEESYDSDFSSSMQSLEGALNGENDVSGVHRGVESPEGYTSDGEDDGVSLCSFGSRADLDRIHSGPVPSWIQIGESVQVLSSRGGPSQSGIVKFIGPTEFASGPWVGVELDQPQGKNDGTVKGVRYFKARSRSGIFVRHDKLIMDKKRRKGSVKTPTGSGTMPAGLRRSMGSLSGSNSQLTNAGSSGGSYKRPNSSRKK
ncbi:kinesin-like protein KIF13A isoform X3 [Lineus longissimus]|uniref:kinesin-like protein KIF13A isoform X3 n=1 Tax=Lineus longissimus TaxID=88925 RepID=UPI00315C8A89